MSYTPESLAERIVNTMDLKDLIRYVVNDLEEWLGDMNEFEFEEQVSLFFSNDTEEPE